jgi:hypothetical protein
MPSPKKQASQPEKASYETIFADLNQEKLILTIARNSRLTPNDKEFLSYLSRTKPALTPQFESLRSPSESTQNQKILAKLVISVYGSNLSKGLDQLITAREKDLIEDLGIKRINRGL